VEDPTYLFIARVPATGLNDYRQFIGRVVPLITEFGAKLERRFASDDATIEVFVVSFPDVGAFEDLQRSTHLDDAAPLLYRSGARFEVIPTAHKAISLG
jgi:hypothetical protein